MLQLRQTVPLDLKAVLDDLSQYDLDQMYENKLIPAESIAFGYERSSDIRTIAGPNGKPLGLIGAFDWQDGAASLWMLVTEELLTNYRLSLSRLGKKWIEEWHYKWPLFVNFVPPHGDTRWIEHVGYTYRGDIEIDNKPFRVFMKEKAIL